MKWIFDLKDVVYLCVNVASVVAIFVSYRNKMREVEKNLYRIEIEMNKAVAKIEVDQNKLKTMIISETGILNFIDTAACKQSKDHIYTAIRNHKDMTDRALEKIDRLSNNIMKIMFHFDIREDD